MRCANARARLERLERVVEQRVVEQVLVDASGDLRARVPELAGDNGQRLARGQRAGGRGGVAPDEQWRGRDDTSLRIGSAASTTPTCTGVL
jgi:hypothetical protein